MSASLQRSRWAVSPQEAGRLLAVALLALSCLHCSRRLEVAAAKAVRAARNGDTDVLKQMLDQHPHLLRQHFQGAQRARRGATLLHLAVRGGQLEATKSLLKRGADPNAEDVHGRTPLHAAAERGDRALLWLLKSRGAEVNVADSRGATPLHLAARHGAAEVAQMLAQPGTQIDAVNEQGETPLHLAAQHARIEIVRTLLKRGADVNIRDNNRRTPRHRVPPGHRELRMMLTEVGARGVRESWTELQTAAARGDVDMIEVLLAEDPGLLAKGDRAERPLLLAAMHGHQAAVEALVGAGADLDSPAGDAPLCFLAARGAVEACRILLELGAEPAAECRNGRTPLHLAAKYSEAEVAQLLLEFDHPVNARDARGKTPLHWAAESTTTRMAEILLEAGADVNAVDGFGTTPLWHAREFGTADMARFLEEHGATVQGD